MARLVVFIWLLFSISLVEIDARPNRLPQTYFNKFGMKFEWIPSGTFIMGSPKEGAVSLLRSIAGFREPS